MIRITDLKGTVRYLNADLIEYIEATPDTQIVLNNGHRHYAQESPQDLVERIVDYRKECNRMPDIVSGKRQDQIE